MTQDTTNGQYIGLTRNTQENTMDTTNEPAIDLRLENVLDVVDSVRHIIFDTGAADDVAAAQGTLLESGEELFGERSRSRDRRHQEMRAFGAYLVLRAVRKTPGAMDTALEMLQARVVVHLLPDILRVFDDAQAPPA